MRQVWGEAPRAKPWERGGIRKANRAFRLAPPAERERPERQAERSAWLRQRNAKDPKGKPSVPSGFASGTRKRSLLPVQETKPFPHVRPAPPKEEPFDRGIWDSSSGSLRVLYDGECGLCRAQARWLRRLDWCRRLRWEDFHVTAAQGTCPAGLGRESLEQSLHVVAADGRVLRGFLAVRLLARCLPALWPLVPLLYIPGAASLGEPLYRLVARNRHRLVRDR